VRVPRRVDALTPHPKAGYPSRVRDLQEHPEHSGHRIAWALSRRATLSLPEPGYVGQLVAEHHAVVAAMTDRDADRAEAALCHHLRMVLSQVPALQREPPELFEDAQA